ncbi:hypothetical protein FSP39_018094 [Pinctada imbricata]|uniref:Uncharacterized protein n=1 Tax=Pinctada imbricata TaxID=66713 RepID=A0AA88Y0Z9_PINIB|nr:hypothetical protein FSP39_018094 [Pinctada imbricata]
MSKMLKVYAGRTDDDDDDDDGRTDGRTDDGRRAMTIAHLSFAQMFCEILIALIAVLLTAVFRYRRRRVTRPFEHSYVVITGCDTGFGRVAAEKFDSLGMHVFAGCLLEKSIQELKDTCSDKLYPALLDITKQDDIDNLLTTLNGKLPHGSGLTGLINNAGVLGVCGLLESLGSDQYIQAFQVNVFGMIDVTKALLPLLRIGKGRIVITSSYAGKFGAPFMGPYFSTKHAVESYSESLRRELYHDSVSVHVVVPGAFRTPVLNLKRFEEDLTEHFHKMSTESKEYYGMDMIKMINKYVVNLEASRDPDFGKVVNAYQHALTSSYPKIRYKVGIDCKILLAMVHYLPEWLTDLIIASQFPVPAGAHKS